MRSPQRLRQTVGAGHADIQKDEIGAVCAHAGGPLEEGKLDIRDAQIVSSDGGSWPLEEITGLLEDGQILGQGIPPRPGALTRLPHIDLAHLPPAPDAPPGPLAAAGHSAREFSEWPSLPHLSGREGQPLTSRPPVVAPL